MLNLFLQKSRSKEFWGWVLISLGMLQLVGQNTIVKVEGAIDLSLVQDYRDQGQEFSYAAPLPPYLWRFADTEESPTRSSLRVFQNGEQLQYPHTIHSRIGEVGDGRYSHWGRYLLFSTIGNVDPRLDGVDIRYTYPCQVLPSGYVLIFLLWASGSLLFFLSRNPSKPAHVLSIFGMNALVTAVGVFLVLAVMEIYLRASAPSPEASSGQQVQANEFEPPFVEPVFPSVYRPGIGYTFEPGSTIKHTNGVDFWTTTRANEWGFADRPIPDLGDAHKSCHITFIGDSFVEAIQVPIDKKSHVLVEQSAQAKLPDLNITTSAFGFSGTGQISQIAFYENFAKKLKPSLIVLVVVSNDFANNSGVLEAVRNGWHPIVSPRAYVKRDASNQMVLVADSPDYVNHMLTEPQPSSLDRHFELFKAYHWIVEKLVYQLGFPQRLIVHRVRQVVAEDTDGVEMEGLLGVRSMAQIDAGFEADRLSPVFEEALNAFKFGLLWFKEEARRADADLLLFSSHSMERSEKLTGYLERASRELDIPLIHQRDGYTGEGKRLSDLNFSNDGHWNELGHQVMADLIGDYISKNRAICD